MQVVVEVDQEEFIKRQRSLPQVEIRQLPSMDCIHAQGRWYGAIVREDQRPAFIWTGDWPTS